MKKLRRFIIPCAIILVIGLCVAYHYVGYIVYESEGVTVYKPDNIEENVHIRLKYRPIEALFKRMKGELAITYQGEEYLCYPLIMKGVEITCYEGNPQYAFEAGSKYKFSAKCGTFLAAYWYKDEDNYSKYKTLQVTFDKLFSMRQIAIESESHYVTFSLPTDGGFKTLVEYYGSPFSNGDPSYSIYGQPDL